MLQLDSGTGKSPPALRNLQTTTEKINIKNDGRPELATPPFKVTKRPDGTAEVKIEAKSKEELQRILPHIAAQIGISEAELADQMANASVGIVEKRPGMVHHPVSLGGHDALRSVVKSCLGLFATVVGNDAIKAKAFDAARNFVLNGDEEFNKSRIQIDSREVPQADILKRAYGDFFNLIYVRSDATGKVVGHFTLYNIISWQIVLAETGGPSKQKTGLVSNPLDPVVWSDRIADTVDIPFNWLATEDRAYELEKAKERLTSMVKRHHEHSLQTEIGRIVDEVCAKHGIMNDHEAIDPAKQPAIFAEITARLGAHSVGIPHQQMITSDEIKRLLRP